MIRRQPWLSLPKSEQLRARFGIPDYDREMRMLLVAGKMMKKVFFIL
jgi:hypothetical protein